MRDRLWYEMTQAKYNNQYTCFLIAYQRQVLNVFNILVAIFSTAGVMGWKFWDKMPIVACCIIAAISLAKLIQPHIIPSDKQIEKLDKIADFYFGFHLKTERIWFDFDNNTIDESQMLTLLHELKETEREINQIVNEVHKKQNKKLAKKAKEECDNFFLKAFKTSI